MDNKSVIEKFNEKCAPFYLVDHDNGTFSLCYPFSFVDEKYRFYGQEAFDKYAERIGEPARDERGFCTHGNGYEWAIVFNKYFLYIKPRIALFERGKGYFYFLTARYTVPRKG